MKYIIVFVMIFMARNTLFAMNTQYSIKEIQRQTKDLINKNARKSLFRAQKQRKEIHPVIFDEASLGLRMACKIHNSIVSSIDHKK